MTDKPLDCKCVHGDVGKVDIKPEISCDRVGHIHFEDRKCLRCGIQVPDYAAPLKYEEIAQYNRFKQKLERDFLLTPRGNKD